MSTPVKQLHDNKEDKDFFPYTHADAVIGLKGKILSLLGELVSISYSVVDVLPEQGELGVIYLVQKDSQDSDNNIYEEYLWVNDKYEMIGDTQADLSLYATIEYVDSKSSSGSEVDLTGYATEKWVTEKGYLTSSSLNNYFNKTATGTTTVKSKIQVGDDNTSIGDAFLHRRSVNGTPYGAVFSVSASDGSAAFTHKTWKGSTGCNTSALRFSKDGLKFGINPNTSGDVPTDSFQNVVLSPQALTIPTPVPGCVLYCNDSGVLEWKQLNELL